MSTVRRPAVAGTFYDQDPIALSNNIEAMLGSPDPSASVPKVIIAPHAGYIYSGQVAAAAYQLLLNEHPPISRVVLLGPSHRVGFKGIAATSVTSYETPLGKIPIDASAVQSVLQLPGTGFLDEAHTQEHSLEVHLPFLQKVLPEFSLVPLVVGDAPVEEVSRVLETLWGGPETLIIISTDLSHYHSYQEAQQLDSHTSQKIVHLKSSLSGEEACGFRPVNGLLHLLAKKNLKVEQVSTANSGDSAGDKDRVVGYGSYIVVEEQAPDTSALLSLAHRQRLLQVAREVILVPLTNNQPNINIDLAQYPAQLLRQLASFVTLNIEGQLRGCIGSLTAHRQLIVDVAHNAQAAAFNDPRFRPLTLPEYQNIDVHISVLSPAQALNVNDREQLAAVLQPGIDGLILEQGEHRATYLPSVWEQLPDPNDFISELKRKAGLPAMGWDKNIVLQRYTTEEFC